MRGWRGHWSKAEQSKAKQSRRTRFSRGLQNFSDILGFSHWQNFTVRLLSVIPPIICHNPETTDNSHCPCYYVFSGNPSIKQPYLQNIKLDTLKPEDICTTDIAYHTQFGLGGVSSFYIIEEEHIWFSLSSDRFTLLTYGFIQFLSEILSLKAMSYSIMSLRLNYVGQLVRVKLAKSGTLLWFQ